MMKAVIIEDEARARRILASLIEEYCPQISIAEMAEDVPSGVLAIKNHEPDIVFLDIEMPGMDGFRLFEFFDEPKFDVIFTTAYNNHALRAFEVSAIDYLLKPIQPDQLIKSVERAEKVRQIGQHNLKERTATLQANMNPNGIINKIALPVSDGLIFVGMDEIICLEADGSYTTIFLTSGAEILVTKYLKDFVDLINHPTFYKPHRSYYINLNHLKKYVKQDGGHIVMSNDKIINLARDNKDEFLEKVMNR